MDSPRSGIWRHVPGYDSDSDDGWSKEMEEEVAEDHAAAKQRFQEILTLLGDRWVDPTPHKFSPAQIRQKGERIPQKRPDQTARVGPAPCFRMDRMLAPVVHDTFISNGLCETHNSDWCVQWTGPGMKDGAWSEIHEFQRVNHFPGSTALTRKDSMYTHLSNMAKQFGREAFDFLPETWVLPEQMQAFMEEYERDGGLFIVKPTNSACGRGIFILRNIRDLPSCSAVVSRYVENPLLIQGLKFDLRVYVLVTQYDPLRAYIYREGLARFASKQYSTEEEHLQDAYRHLTNYSINKSAPNFTENQDLNEDNYGHKWSLSALNRHLRCVGVDHHAMWSRIMDLIVKTLLAVEGTISQRTQRVTNHQGVCFEIYGFDVLVDEDLKPWILEVNLSPSMQAESPLDWQVKSSLLSDAFNLIGVCHAEFRAVQASRLRGQIAQMRASHKALIRERGTNSMTGLTPSPKRGSERDGAGKRASVRKPTLGISPAEVPVVLDTLTEGQLKMLARSIQEFDRCHNFIRLYPTRGAMERYRPIMECRSTVRFRSATGGTASNHLLASLLFGPPPRKSTAHGMMSMQAPGQGAQQKEQQSSNFGSSHRRSYVDSLRRSLIALQLQRTPAAQRAISSDALSPAAAAAEAFDTEDSASPVDASGASGPEGLESPREAIEEESPRKASRAAHFIADLDPEDRHRLALLEYLVRTVRTCDALSSEERAVLAQSGAYSRLSRFRSRLQMLTVRSLSAQDGRHPVTPPRPSSAVSAVSASGRACLIEEVVTACRTSLEALARRPWKPEAERGAEEAREAPEAEHRGWLAPYLPEDFGLAGPRRQALSFLPVLGPAELEGLVRSEQGCEEFGAWSELFACIDSTGRPYSLLRDILQSRRRAPSRPTTAAKRSPGYADRRQASRRPTSASSLTTAAALDNEGGLGATTRRSTMHVLDDQLTRSRQGIGARGVEETPPRRPRTPGSPSRRAAAPAESPSPPPPLNAPAPAVSRQWSAPLLPDLKATERPKFPQKQALVERMRSKSTQLLMGRGQQVASSLGRPPMIEMDSIEL